MKLKLENVRLSFPDLFEPKQFEGKGPFSYRAQFLVPKGHKARRAIEDEINRVATEKWGKKAEQVLAGLKGNSQKFCWIDGHTKEYDGYAEHYALSATRGSEKGKPLVLSASKTPLTASDGKPYAGCYVNASVEIWAQDNSFGKGIRATLLGVQFYKDGDAFAAGASASEEDFETLDAGEEAEDLI